MTSEENRLRAEAWYNANIVLREKPSFEFVEEVERMREKLKAYENDFVRVHGETFLSNINSALLLVTTPIENYMDSVFKLYGTHIKQMNSPNEIFGELLVRFFQAFTKKPEETEPSESPANSDPDRQKAKEFYEIVKTVKSGGDPQLLLKLIKDTVVGKLEESPELIDWTSKLFEASLCSAWTSYEVIAADLWVSIVNHSIVAAKNACNFELNQTSSESKKIELSLLFHYDLNLNGKMGILLKDKFDFTGESGIRTAYNACFNPKAERLEQAEEKDMRRNAGLYATEQKRHVILHNGGVFDQDFVDKMRKIGAEQRVGDRMNLTVLDLEESIEAVFREGCKLLERSEDWLKKQKKLHEMKN